MGGMDNRKIPIGVIHLYAAGHLELRYSYEKALQQHGIDTIGDIYKFTEGELLRKTGIGRKCIRQINKGLSSLGLPSLLKSGVG